MHDDSRSLLTHLYLSVWTVSRRHSVLPFRDRNRLGAVVATWKLFTKLEAMTLNACNALLAP